MSEGESGGAVDRSEGDVNLSPRRDAHLARHLGPRGRELVARDEAVFFRQALSTPCLDAILAAHGARLRTADGRELLDFHGNSVHQLGFGHPRVVAAVKRALDELPFCPRRFTNPYAVELAERLCAAAPGGPWKLLLAPAGTVAVGMALRLVRHLTGRHKILSFWGSFHGVGLDAASVGGEALFRREVGPLLPATEHLPPPTRGRCPHGCTDDAHSGCLERIDRVLAAEGDFAALFAEPVRWTTVELPPPGFWRAVREICDRHGVLLVFDEIPSCLGRSGSLFVYEQMQAVPDILLLGKGLGGGLFPLAAMLAKAAFDRFPAFAIGHVTHEKSSVGCAAALATLAVIEEEDLCGRVRRLGELVLGRLRERLRGHPLVAEVRGIGMQWALELRRPDGAPAVAEAEEVLYGCLARGLSFKIGAGSTLVLGPPLTIARAELEAALAILEDELGRLA
ncbi:5-aminovalerate aminotransferase DavT [bacterium HR40]|nr:5-aminovalerate aminotransferase DavT [bacterium HR40]